MQGAFCNIQLSGAIWCRPSRQSYKEAAPRILPARWKEDAFKHGQHKFTVSNTCRWSHLCCCRDDSITCLVCITNCTVPYLRHRYLLWYCQLSLHCRECYSPTMLMSVEFLVQGTRACRKQTKGNWLSWKSPAMVAQKSMDSLDRNLILFDLIGQNLNNNWWLLYSYSCDGGHFWN